jgi:hypothetical protein
MWGLREPQNRSRLFAALVNGYYRSKDLVYREFAVGFVPASGRMGFTRS